MVCLLGLCSAFSLMVKSAISGLAAISTSSSLMMIGCTALPSFSSVQDGIGSLAFRQVACFAKQGARLGATEVDEIVLMEEMEEARDERERSEIMLSGLDRDDALAIEGRRDVGYAEGPYGNCSNAQRLKPAC